MKTLIVFEDMYGIADIYKAIKSVESKSRRVARVNDDVDIITGCTNINSISLRGDVRKYTSSYDLIVSVFDIDKLGKSLSNTVISTNAFKHLVHKYKCKGFEHLYMPIVYNAETIMLYQYLVSNGGIDVVDIVNQEDTYKFQLKLLNEVINLNMEVNDKFISAKHVHEYLNITKLRTGLSKGNGINRYFKRWVMRNCDSDVTLFANEEDVIALLSEAQENMNARLRLDLSSLSVSNGYVINLKAGDNEPALIRE